ncbi:MAG: hypothetical protein OHK0052_21060 [Anaerolineales bacterium]
MANWVTRFLGGGGRLRQLSRRHWVWVLGAFGVYILMFGWIYNAMGITGVALSLLPMMLVAWLGGLRFGLLASVGVILLNLVLLILTVGFDGINPVGAFIGSLLQVVAAAVVGWASDLVQEVQAQARALEEQVQERRRAQHALQNRERLLRAIFDNVPIMVAAVSQRGEFTLVQGHAEQVFGLAAQELIGLPIAAVGEQQPQAFEALQKALQGTRFNTTLTFNGFVFETWFTPLKKSDGAADGFAMVATDVTLRKQIEEALNQQRQILEHLVTVARATVENPNLEQTLENTLNAAVEITGAQAGTVLLLNAQREVTHSLLARGLSQPIERDRLLKLVMDRGLAGWVARHRRYGLIEDISSDERWIKLPNSPHQTGSALALPINSGAEMVGILTLQHDQPGYFTQAHVFLMQAAVDQIALTFRNARIYENQRMLAARQTTLYETLRALSQFTGSAQVLEAAAEVIAKHTGWTTLAILILDETGENLEVMASAGALGIAQGWKIPITRGIVGRCWRTETAQLVDDVRSDADYVMGAEPMASELSVPLRRGTQMIGVLDIESPQFAGFSKEDRLLAESLAEVIALSLENARLFEETQHTAERLRELDQLKSNFLASMSHELRTPLNAILGYSELIEEDARELGYNEILPDLARIHKSGQHLLTLINDILDLSKIEAGKMTLMLEKFDLDSVLADLQETVAPLMQRQNNRLNVVYEAPPGSVYGDSTRIRQILLNLLSNAAKFTQNGKITLRVARSTKQARNWIHVCIEDTGMGIEPEQMQRLFQPFSQGKQVLSGQYGGTGLGLAISQRFAKMMGGSIEAESVLHEGSRFTLHLPEEAQSNNTDTTVK